MRTLKIASRITATLLALSLLGGGVALAGDDATGESGESTDTSKPVDDDAKPHVPAELIEAVTSLRDAVKTWRHCIIDMVSADAEGESCGSAPSPDDHGLSEADLLAFDLDERIAAKVDRKLTRIQIRTSCLEAHATEGRRAVYECVFEAIKAEFGDKAANRLKERQTCRRGEAAAPEVTTPVAETDKDASEDCSKDNRGMRERRGGDGESTGGRHGTKDA